MSKHIIYALLDPQTLEIRYIGKSSSGLNRPKHHLHPSVYNSLHIPLYLWIKKLKAKNLSPVIEILEETKADRLSGREIHYIKIAREFGYRLLNLTEGGDGGGFGRAVSEEVRNRLSELYKCRGHRPPLHAIEKARIVNTGRKQTEEEKEKRGKTCRDTLGKQVVCLNTGQIYSGVREAARDKGCDHRGIGRVCSGEYKQYKGLKWKFSN